MLLTSGFGVGGEGFCYIHRRVSVWHGGEMFVETGNTGTWQGLDQRNGKDH